MTTEKSARFNTSMASATLGKNSKSCQRVMYWPSGALRLMTPSRSRNTALCMKQFLFDQFGHDVPDENMTLLNARRLARRSTETKVHVCRQFQLSSGSTRKSNGQQAKTFRCHKSLYNIRGVSAGRYSDCRVTCTGQRFQLAGEDVLKAIVVGDRCKAGGIHGERQCSKSRTINHETAYKVRGEVLRIRRTTTIPEKENF